MKKIIGYLSSLNLALFVLTGLAVVSAVGTFVESKYDARVASALVYQSFYMYFFLILLVINLVAVIVSRYPWKKHHLGFILAHVGIIVLLVGAWLTQQNGLDGSLTLPINGKNRYLTLSDTDLIVQATMDGDKWSNMFHREVSFIKNNPKEHPLEIPLPDATLKITNYYHYAFEDKKIEAVEAGSAGAAAVRFQLQNQHVNVTDWLFQRNGTQPEVKDLGPARVVLADGAQAESGRNEIILWPNAKNAEELNYAIHYTDKNRKTKQGRIRIGDVVEPGWMGLQFRIFKYFPKAREVSKFRELKSSTDMANSAIEVEFNGKKYWTSLNSPMKLFTEQGAYRIYYINRMFDLGMDIQLAEFRMGRYQGTNRAASYESDVIVPELGRVNISMNEPMKFRGLTFYQASFNEDEKGQPIASILSVNYDPGRWLKYLGSLLIVFGIILMFYFKRWDKFFVNQIPKKIKVVTK